MQLTHCSIFVLYIYYFVFSCAAAKVGGVKTKWEVNFLSPFIFHTSLLKSKSAV